MMEMPKPQPEHAKLNFLTGKWVGEEKILPSPWDPQGGPATSKVEARTDLDGFNVIMDYVETRNGQIAFRGHGVFGFDCNEKVYTMHWFDSMGANATPVAKGRLDGNRLVFTNQTPMGQGRYSYEMQGEGRYRFTIENSQDGKNWAMFMDGQYKKV